MQGISRHDEADLPIFKSYEEAINYFEETYGEKFVFEESSNTDDGICFFYRLIIDEVAYIEGAADLNSNGSVGLNFLKSYQTIQIMEDGTVRIAR